MQKVSLEPCCVLPCGSFTWIVSASADLSRAFVGGFDSFHSIINVSKIFVLRQNASNSHFRIDVVT